MTEKISPSTPSAQQIRRWRKYLADEHAEAAVYRDLATRREGGEREILLALADAEGRHAAHWRTLLGDHADDVAPHPRGSLLGWLARRFGSVFVLALVQRAEGRSAYAADDDATAAMAADERIHEEVVRSLATRGRAQMSGNFRAAVFGANDGLVSNLALILGIGASGVANSVVLLSGLAGLLAGALSMGAGEFVSVSSQRELADASTPDPEVHAVLPDLDVDANDGLVSNLALILGIGASGVANSVVLLSGLAGLLAGALSMGAGEFVSVSSQRELADASTPDPEVHAVLPDLDVDANELALVYRARGMAEHEAVAHAANVLANLSGDASDGDRAGFPSAAGRDGRHDLIGTPWGAAISSFLFFASGAIIPVLPYLFGAQGWTAVVLATGMVAAALCLTGAAVGVLSGTSPITRAIRQIAIGIGAAAATYALGLLFGGMTGG